MNPRGRINPQPQFRTTTKGGAPVQVRGWFAVMVRIVNTKESRNVFAVAVKEARCAALPMNEFGADFMLCGQTIPQLSAALHYLDAQLVKEPTTDDNRRAPRNRVPLLRSVEYVLSGVAIPYLAAGSGGGDGWKPKVLTVPREEQLPQYRGETGRAHVPSRKIGVGEEHVPATNYSEE